MPDETFEVELTDMAHGGSAIGRHAGRVVFVPYTIPGERALVRLTSEKGRVAFAEGLQLVEASADRVFPRCPHFGPGRCGRCQWQHIAYPAQLLLKQDVLADQLARIGGFDEADVRPVIPAPLEWHYNHHMTFDVTTPDGGAPRLALPSAEAGRLAAIDECFILHPDLLALKDALDLSELAGVERIKLQIGTGGAPMLILTMANEDAPELLADLPASVNLLLPDNEPVNLIGESHVRYTVGERNFRVTAGAFFRPNVLQLERLVSAVMDALDLGDNPAVLDLYAGVGLFAAFIAPRARLVTLVESYPPAATDADENLADFDNVDIFEGAVEDVLDALEDRYDAAVLDPPPDGLSRAALDGLLDLDVPRLVYVSADPSTLARDGKRLAAAGYRLLYIQPVDLAPQTFMVDAVAVFERK